MAMKSCSYYKCNNSVLDGTRSAKFTMFEFPENEELRKEWILLGNVPNHNSNSKLFMCSDHFESKYISVQLRSLLSTDVVKPIPYVSTNKSDGEASSNGKGNGLKIEPSGDDEHQLSISKKSDNDSDVKPTQSSLSAKRSAPHTTGGKGGTTMAKRPLISNEIDFDPKVTTFIVKGEEYIQMPNINYKEEMDILKKELKRYKEIAQQIGTILSQFNKLQTNSEQHIPSSEMRSVANTPVFIKSEFVKKFSFKGEEFVEMRKSYYMQEKAKLESELESYKTYVNKLNSAYGDLQYKLSN